MARKVKNSKKEQLEYDLTKSYTIDDAIEIVKKLTKTKFDASFDLAIKLGVDPRKSDQMVRGSVLLPNGTGKVIRTAVVCSSDKEQEAKQAGADYIGGDEMLKKIESGWTDFDVLVTTPTMMVKIGKLGKILGPRGLMPNPKTGTVTPNIKDAILAIKSGKINFKVDKYGIIHSSIGRASFKSDKLKQNILELYISILKLKPSSSKGTYIKSLSLSTTMSKGVFIDNQTISI